MTAKIVAGRPVKRERGAPGKIPRHLMGAILKGRASRFAWDRYGKQIVAAQSRAVSRYLRALVANTAPHPLHAILMEPSNYQLQIAKAVGVGASHLFGASYVELQPYPQPGGETPK